MYYIIILAAMHFEILLNFHPHYPHPTQRQFTKSPNIDYQTYDKVLLLIGPKWLMMWWVVGLASLALGFLDLHLNLTGFQVLSCFTGCGYGHFWYSCFGYFIQNTYVSRFFRSYSPCTKLRWKNSFWMCKTMSRELVNTKMLKIIEDYHKNWRFLFRSAVWALAFLHAAFWVFANFSSDWLVLVPPKPPSLMFAPILEGNTISQWKTLFCTILFKGSRQLYLVVAINRP